MARRGFAAVREPVTCALTLRYLGLRDLPSSLFRISGKYIPSTVGESVTTSVTHLCSGCRSRIVFRSSDFGLREIPEQPITNKTLPPPSMNSGNSSKSIKVVTRYPDRMSTRPCLLIGCHARSPTTPRSSNSPGVVSRESFVWPASDFLVRLVDCRFHIRPKRATLVVPQAPGSDNDLNLIATFEHAVDSQQLLNLRVPC